MTKEEIQAKLKDNNLTLGDLSRLMKELEKLQAEEALTVEAPKEPIVKKVSSTTPLTFILKNVSYPDFVLERVTPKTVKQLVFMPSCQQYYIKSVKGDNANAERLDADSYAAFTAGMDDIKMPEDFWVNIIQSGKRYYDRITHFINQEHNRNSKKYTVIELIKNHVCKQLDINQYYSTYCSYDNRIDELRAYAVSPVLFKEFYNSEKAHNFMLKVPEDVEFIINCFGLNNTRDFLHVLEISLVVFNQNYYLGNRIGFLQPENYSSPHLPNIAMDYEKFKEFILYTSVRIGCGNNIADFIQTWNDYLRMSNKVDGKIKNKYPDHLLEEHSKYSYKVCLLKTQIDEKKFNEQFKIASAYEWKMDKDEGRFMFIAPTCPNDFYDEATQQANCLASYVDKYADGKDIIIFMRDKETPETSCVTIEIVNDKITQAYEAHNKIVNAEEHDAISKWAKKYKLEY